jgi:hypothetical protein
MKSTFLPETQFAYLLQVFPITWLCFGLLAYAPGTLLLRPFATAFGGMVRHAAALLLGWAFYTFFADVTLKFFGPTIWGFYLAPGLLVWACGLIVARTAVARSTDESEPSLSLTNSQALFACLLGVVAVLQVIPTEFEWNGGVYWGTPEIDWRSRLPVTNAIARDGLPAANPFFNPDGDSKLFFYYGFFLLPAACVHPTIQPGTSGWDTVGVMALCVFLVGWMVALFAIALGNFAVGDKRGGWVSGLLCYVTGLDLLPVLALTLRGTPPSSLEWWNPAQITAATAFPVWVPHHTLATLDVILAHVLAWNLDRSPRTAVRGLAVIAVLLAAAAMTSTYVAMLGFLSIFIHGLLRARRLGAWRKGSAPILATILGGVMALPFYYQLSKLDQYRAPAIQPIIRPCPSEEPIHDAVASTLGVSKPVALFLTRLGGLFPQYFFELGFLFFVLMFWKRTGIGSGDPDGLWNRLGVMVVVAFVVGSIFVSVRTWNCDLNWRIMHPVQIALLGAAAAFWRDFRSKPRPMIDKFGVAFFLAVGVAGTCYDLVRSRWDYLSHVDVGVKTRNALEAAEWINRSTPTGDRIAIDPRTDANEYFGHLLRRQLVISDDTFNAFPYGPHPDRVKEVAAEMIEAFSANTTVERRRAILHRYNVSYVLIDRNSELFERDVKATFGRTAFIVNDHGAERWKVIGCETGPFK